MSAASAVGSALGIPASANQNIAINEQALYRPQSGRLAATRSRIRITVADSQQELRLDEFKDTNAIPVIGDTIAKKSDNTQHLVIKVRDGEEQAELGGRIGRIPMG